MPTPSHDDPRSIWSRLAPFWDSALGEGNDFQLHLIMPATTRLLNPQPNQKILDIACGNGNYARRLASLGCRLTAFDIAPAFIEAARKRSSLLSPQSSVPITYQVADATDEQSMLSLAAPHTFDAVVCSMAIMDLPTLDPLLRSLKTLLKPSAQFVLSIPHPCFNTPHTRMTAELLAQDGRPEQLYAISTSRYLTPTTTLSSGLLNQPEPHPLYHRPLSLLLSTFASHNFFLDALEEPSFPKGHASAKHAFSWKSRPDLPPALVARMRLQSPKRE